MTVDFDTREAAAERFNRLLSGSWGPRDMALYDVYLRGWSREAIPIRCWLPATHVDLVAAAGSAVELPPGFVVDVRRLSSKAAAAVESAAAEDDWKRYG
ncbi:MAG TPA: hypothetical protein VM687_10490 [Stenotrophomonas sp.]|nr:hypothetical protein [Stenotrophomonas sp.]